MSWLSNNLTGGLSSISNFTGQLSSFTREMLTEGTEEVSDPSAELKVAQVHINELEARLLSQKSEYERLKQNNEELHVRLEASELQISNIFKEYRMQLQNKEQELIKLRELSRIHEEQGHALERRERHDSTDSIEDSIESKRLRSEISRLQTECQHWKSLANGMENQDRHKEIDQYQQELAALQSSYSQKISTLNKKHKQEVQKLQEEKEEYVQRIEELEELLQAENKQGRDTHNFPEDRSEGEVTCRTEGEATSSLSLRNELDLAKKRMVELRDRVKVQEDDITFLNTELEEKKDALTKAQTSLIDTQEKLSELRVSDQEMTASKDALNECYKRIEVLENQVQEQNRELETHRGNSENLRTLHEEFDFLTQQNLELKEQLHRSQSEERRMRRSVEEVKSELEQLSCSTMELMEELQISQGLQKEQMIEIESLKNVRHVKGEAKVEVAKFRSALAALWERHLNLVQLYQQVRHELHNSNTRLMAMFQAQHLSTQTASDDLNELQQRLAKRSEAKLETVVREKEAMMGHSAELRVTVEELEGAVMDLQSDNEQLAQEAKDCVVVIGRQLDTDEVDEGGDIVTALQAEKAVLESTIVGLEKKVQDLQEHVITLQKQKPWRDNNETVEDQPSRSGSAESVSSMTEGTPQVNKSRIDMGDFRPENDATEPEVRRDSEVSLEGSYIHERDVLPPDQQLSDHELRRQLEAYQQQVEEFELVRKDWEGEKEALEGLVLDLRRQVKEQQVKLATLVEEHSNSEAACAEQLRVLQDEKRRSLAEKTNLLEAWKTMEEDFVTLDISSPRADKDFEDPAIQRINSLRSDLKDWVLNNSSQVPSAAPVEGPSNVESENRHVTEETQTDESIFLLRNTLEDFEKDNSLLRQQTERLIQEIEEKTSKMTVLQIELETKSSDLKGLSEEKRNLMVMINERDERIGELEESFNTHLSELTSSKDNEVSLLETEKEDLVKLLEENRQESALLRSKNNQLLDFMGQNQQANDELREQNVSLASVLAKKEADLGVSVGENNKLLSTLQDKDHLNASLTAENKSLLMEKEVLQTLVEEYKEKFDAQKNENANSVKLLGEIECLKEKIQSSEEGWRELEMQQVVACQENERLQVDLGQRQTELDNTKLELKETFSQIQNLTAEKEKLNGVVRDQVSALKDLEQKLAGNTKEVEELKESFGIKDVEVDKLELDLREKGAENDLLRLDIAKLSRELKEKEELIRTQVLKASDSSASSADDTQSRLADLTRLLLFKDQEIAALKQKDASLVELVSQTDRSSHQAHEEYELKIQQAADERNRLLADLSLRDEELLTVQDRLDAMREKMQSKDQASHLLNAEHARLLSLNESQAKEMGRLRERYSSLQKLLEEREKGKSAEAQRVHDENEQLKRKIGTLKVEHETLTTLVHEKDKQIATLALLGSPASPVPSPHGNDVDQQQIKRLREERDVLIRERDSVYREKESKEQQISAMQEDVYTLKQTVDEKTSLAVKLAAKNEELGKQIADLYSQVETLSIEKSNLARNDNRIIQLEEEIRLIRGILGNKDEELKQIMERNRNEKTSILIELDNVRSERDDILEQKDAETHELKNKVLQLAHALTDSDRWREESVNAEDIDRNFQTLIYTVKNQRNAVLRERDNEIRSLREQLSNMTLLTKSASSQDSGLEEVLHEKEELHRMLLQMRDEKEDLLREKECTVADLQEQVISLSRIVSDKERASQQDLERVIHDKERIVKELDQARRDWDEANRAGSRWQAEVSRLQSELHEVNAVLTKERDSVTSLREEIEQSKLAVHEKERIVKDLMVEREQLQRTGEQLQRRVQELQEELTAASNGRKEAEAKKVQELERLRNHLVQVEESYTREALEAEEREKDLRMKIARAEEQLMSSSHSMLDRHRQASVQIESLNEQLQALAAQRDHAVLELASAQEQAHQYQTSLTNLQLVLEQFQKERESQLKGTQEQAQRDIQRAWAEVKALQQRENQLKSQLEMAARVTQEVMYLRGQLNLKQEELQQQSEEVTRLEEELRVSQERIKNLNSLSDNKVEKSLLRNLLMGYFTTPENKRAEVLRVIGGLLGFTHEELDKVGTGSSAPKTSSWISSFNPFAHTPPKTPTRTTAPVHPQVKAYKSFSELFVSFLESESEVPRSSSDGGAQSIVSNPLLSGLTPHPSTVTNPSLPGSARPMATSTPIGTPLRNNLPTAPPPSLSRSLMGAVPNAIDGTRRPSNTSINENPLLAGSLAPAQELPALSSSNSLRTVLEGQS